MDKPMLVLQPTFDEAADPIALLAALTPIGRDHPQIVRYGEACLVALETRHARIILEQDAPILLDLSESGATLRNGEPVGNGPVAINQGDVLKFGDALEFRVQPLQNPDPQVTRMLTQPQQVVLLLLTPLAENGPDAVIAVTEFPFLIASSDGHFATYQATHPEPASFLSRRHAHIYLSDDVLLLEDLGSTNGTQHNGQALRQQAVPLTNGDQVRFGHKDFTFEVAVTVEQASEHVTQRALPEGTVMIASAGSFLDVYCDNGSVVDAARSGDTDTGMASVTESASARRPDLAAMLLAARVQWQQWPYLRLRQIGVFLLLPAVLLALGVVASTRDTRAEQVQELLDQDQPRAALMVAADYAREQGQQARAQQLLESAFEQALLPGWIERMQSSDPQAALELLDEHVQMAPALAEGRTVALLRWLSQLDLFMAPSDGALTVSVASDNRQLQALAAEWRDNADHYTRLLRRYTDSYAELALVHTRAMSSIRAIQGEGADQLKAVAQLHTQLTELLAQSQFEAARAQVAQFKVEHPQIGGVAPFAADLEQLAVMNRMRTDQDLVGFLAATENLNFETAFFGKSISQLAIARRQALDAQQQFGQATAAWQEGQLQAAVAALAADEDSLWRGVLNQRRDRYSRLQQGFDELLAQVGTSEYPNAVIDFYARLDADDDAFMRAALADDFTNQRERAVTNARQLAEQGAQRWATYNQTFQGIGGGLRLEAAVSDTYRELAQQLGQSVTALNRAQRLFTLLDVPAPAALAEQQEAAHQEVIRQRSALASLRSVLGEAVVGEKLQLLPDPEWPL